MVRKSRPTKAAARPDAAPASAEPVPGIERSRPPEPVETTALLLTRRQAGRLLGVSNTTLIRMETAGVLHPIKLTRNPAGQTFYRKANVLVVAERGAADA
jgi:hypothetical protein